MHPLSSESTRKEGMIVYCQEFAKRGAATINYRLGRDQSNKDDQIVASYRAQQDAIAAMRFIVNNANIARIDTNWLFIGGSSAGAVTLLLANNVCSALTVDSPGGHGMVRRENKFRLSSV